MSPDTWYLLPGFVLTPVVFSYILSLLQFCNNSFVPSLANNPLFSAPLSCDYYIPLSCNMCNPLSCDSYNLLSCHRCNLFSCVRCNILSCAVPYCFIMYLPNNPHIDSSCNKYVTTWFKTTFPCPVLVVILCCYYPIAKLSPASAESELSIKLHLSNKIVLF